MNSCVCMYRGVCMSFGVFMCVGAYVEGVVGLGQCMKWRDEKLLVASITWKRLPKTSKEDKMLKTFLEYEKERWILGRRKKERKKERKKNNWREKLLKNNTEDKYVKIKKKTKPFFILFLSK